MKKLFSVLLVLALLLCSACSGKGGSEGNTGGGELQIFMPGEYISDEVISAFEKETGIEVKITNFDSNESMYTKLLGGSVYDIIIPSDYMIERLIAEGMVQKIDKSQVPNLSLLYDGVKNMDYDPDNDYSVPYFWGNVGIVYDGTLVDEADVTSQGWEVLRNTKYAGMIYMYDSVRDSFMMALKALGYSMNTSNQDELNAAFDWLVQISKTMDPAFVTDEAIDGLAYGEKAMGMMYSGDAAYILSENENMRYYAPEEGTNYWVDAMVLHKDSKNLENAYKFMNYIIDYDAQYENSAYVGYASVNAEVLNDLSHEDFDGNEAYIPRQQNAKDEVFHNDEATLKVIAELWVKVKNN
ncbi:MAG: ABC transporter substrate-binding protein [Erysipelotrichaceae bacterium]|nr:ABC transporter substrate-binding protein [Erysipelotrichaceae bacterium]